MPELIKGSHKDLEKYYSLMQMDFDSEELLSKLQLHRAMLNGNAELLIFRDAAACMDLAYALVLPRSVYGYVLLKYMGVLPWYREKGIGIDLMRALNKRYADSQGIIAEVTDFPDQDPDHQKKLMKFFRRFGYEELAADYTISGTAAHVFVKAMKNRESIAPSLHRIIGDFYSRLMTPAAMSKMIAIRRLEPEE